MSKGNDTFWEMTWLYGVAFEEKEKLYDKNIIVYQARAEQRRKGQKKGRRRENEKKKKKRESNQLPKPLKILM